MELLSIRQDGKTSNGSFFYAVQDKPMKNLLISSMPRESRPEKVGPRITALRETLALSKADFADSIHLDRSTLTKIEKGTQGLDIVMAERIAVLYGFGLDYIYRGDLDDIPTNLRAQVLANAFIFSQKP
jgi:DNA-binding XRE family transcriptional regulator